MVESLIVVALALGVVLVAVTPWVSLLLVGAVVTAVGLAFGIAASVWR